MNVSARKGVFLAAAVGGMALLGACKDKRIENVTEGITRDSMLTLISPGAKGIDSLPNVYRRERYLIDGKYYEIFYFGGGGDHLNPATKDTVPWKDLTPIVMVDLKVAGKEWPYWDSLSKAHNIPLKSRS
jgi:hypothetical protein